MFTALYSKQPHAVAVLVQLIRKLNVKVSSFTIKKNLEDHPDYPSLLSLSDCLTSWKVPHEVYKIDKNDLNTEELPFPFLAHLLEDNGRFTLVQKIKNGKVKCTNEFGATQILSESEFQVKWDGIILYAQKDEQSGEANYNHALIKGWFDALRLPFLLAILILGFFIVDRNDTSIVYFILLGLKLVGVGLSALLLMHSINADNPFIQNLCGLGEKNDCNSILKSDSAQITRWLNWSEVGMFYFAGSLTCLLLNSFSTSLLTWLSVLCLPYTFYSIIYQIRIRSWCTLCCCVQLLLWTEALIFLLNYGFPSFSFNSVNWLSIVFCFLLPIGIWSVIKPLLINSEQIRPLKFQLKEFKYNAVLFDQQLKMQPYFLIPVDITPIILGNLKGEIVITIISNPFCNPCSKAHEIMDSWLSYRNDIKLNVVFSTHNEGPKAKVIQHFNSLGLSKDKEVIKQALNDWYSSQNKDYDAWAAKYPVDLNNEIVEVLEKQRTWCEMAGISATPTIFINGYKLTNPYQLEDIEYLI